MTKNKTDFKRAVTPCVTCRYAEWNRTPTGRIKKLECGRCLYPLDDKEILSLIYKHIPYCYSATVPHRTAIWPDTAIAGEVICSVYEPREETTNANRKTRQG